MSGQSEGDTAQVLDQGAARRRRLLSSCTIAPSSFQERCIEKRRQKEGICAGSIPSSSCHKLLRYITNFENGHLRLSLTVAFWQRHVVSAAPVWRDWFSPELLA
jgi:hypothetical protein